MVPESGSEVSDEGLDRMLPEIHRSVRRALVARCGLEVGAEAAADAMAWALVNRTRLESIDNPAGYLYRVGLSSVRREWRIARRRGRLLFEPVVEPDSTFDEELFAALARLNRDQRVAVVLVHAYGYRYREVAELTGLSETAITNHVHRGLRRLRVLLGDRP
jgi:RNA polymerase sigma-70 factor (ECF subfamily)